MMHHDNIVTSGKGVLWMLLLLLVSASGSFSQSPNVVFESAFQRTFTVTACSNTNPIVVTIRPPGADDPLTFIPLDAGSLVTISGVMGISNCNVTDHAINVLTATTFELVGVAGNGDYIRGGVGITDTISDARASIPLSNVGQGGNLISVEFPTAVAPVTPIQVRLEAAYVCLDPPFCGVQADWRPLSEDVTVVDDIGGTYYQFAIANGTWRAIRVRSVLPTPGNLPMRVDYTGMPYPIGGVINLGDRFELVTPWGGNSYPDGGLEFVAGACQNGSASLAFNGGTALPLPEAICIEDDQELAVAAFDDTTTEYVQDAFLLAPQGTVGLIQVTVEHTAANTGTVEFAVQYACGGPGAALGSLNWSTPTTAVGTVGTANQLAVTTFNVPVTGCLASNFLFWQFSRTGGQGTLTGDSLVKSINFLPNQ
jgi:hypothetical protein